MIASRITLALILAVAAARPARADAPDTPPAPTNEVAQATFKRESIRFDATYETDPSTGSDRPQRRWRTYRGGAYQVLEPGDFYTAVGRPDLAAQYNHRHAMATGSAIVGLATLGSGLTLLVVGAYMIGGCRDAAASDPCHSDSYQLKGNLVAWSGFGLIIASIIPTYMIVHYRNTMHPISEDAARSLADEYNQGLRRRLGMPVVKRDARIRELGIAPYVGGHDAGFAVGARF